MASHALVAASSASSTPSPSKGSPSKAAKHPAVLRLPLPEKSGNINEDEDRSAQHALLLELVQGCLDDRSHIMPLYNKFRERLQQNTVGAAGVKMAHNEQFNKISTLGALYTTETAFCVSFLVSIGDLSASDITKACTAVAGAGLQLLEFAVSMRDDLKLPQQMKIKDVCLRAFNYRNKALANRLSNFKSGGGLNSDGSLNWENGVYKIYCEQDILATIEHVTSGTSIDIKEHQLSTSYILESNWSDMRARFKRAPLPPVYVHTLFPPKTGPHKICQFSNKSKSLADFAEDRMKEWEAGKMGVVADDPASHAAVVVKDFQLEQRRTAMMKARDCAKQHSEAKRAKTMVSLHNKKRPVVVAQDAA